MLYTAEGNLRAEERALCHVARGRIRAALAQIEAKTGSLLDALAAHMNASVNIKLTPDEALNLSVEHPQLRSERIALERYTDAFPELREGAVSTLEYINRNARRKLDKILAPVEFQRRFAHTRGLHA